MPHSYGYRARTRSLFSQPFRKRGPVTLAKYLTTYRLGDYVDVKGNGSIHKGMPHKFYHGKTGVVWNVTKTSVGVEINKTVRNRIIKKRIHVRVEHVQPSRCREDFLKRVKDNAEKRKIAKESKKRVGLLKRQPALPRPGKIVKAKYSTVETVAPLKYELLL
eukprot:TRINITY_DN678_c0_g1_i1.p1 TRINITY_DN678_c0_g1~~TRINITY_DN678_c0_g1_i1.p1  ORF type:complete len:162 (+),score=17.97 TRINITY_DN678_c0_g1_i1:34-519(+)